MKTEPVEVAEAPVVFHFRRDSETDDSNPSILELISDIRTAFRPSDFDRLEEILITRDEKLKREIEKWKEQYELTRESLGIERLIKAELEEDLKSFKVKCAELENLRENIDAMRERATTAEERAKSSEEIYEKLLRKVKMAESEKSCDLVELRKKNGELESEKTRAEEEVELWKRRFVEMEKRVSKLEADIEILSAENGGGNLVPTILITDSDDDCAPGASCSEKELSPTVLKRKQSSSVNVNEDENGDDDVVPDKRMRQDQELVVGDSCGNPDPATVTCATNDPENNVPSNQGQGFLGPSEANGAPRIRDFSNYFANCLGDEVEFKDSSSSSDTDSDW
ncbi:epidermal growth factor receptor substrate 15 [Morus notabilis]|nr:epidermal growth factor receptor substrate 15 [Morus notabilis]XP_024026949.1 epidermal growth factor receptor substrate 15 [Morus notabilis]